MLQKKNNLIKLSLSEIVYPKAPEGMIHVMARSCLLAENIIAGGRACGEWIKKKYKNKKTPSYIKKVVGPILDDIYISGVEKKLYVIPYIKSF